MEYNIIYCDVVDSTNEEIRRLAKNGEEQGLVVVAEKQTAGKGRRGRSWDSPEGTNLHFSILLRPNVEPENAPMLTLVMAYSVAQVIREEEKLPIQIKWPNDLVCSGKKLCGILTEMHLSGRQIEDVVVGVGINVNTAGFPDDLKDKATSLFMEKAEKVDRGLLLNSILEEFQKWYGYFLKEQNLSFMKEAYNRMLVNGNREVLVMEPGKEYQAEALGINEQGELLVKKQDGSVETVFAGEVSVRGIYGYV